jgi:uncharacterized protein (DUF1697 family)
MALVALLKGINVGGHRAFPPSRVAGALARFGAVNVGAAGTFVVRKRISQKQLRAEIRRCLPFLAEIVICNGRELQALVSQNPFAGQSSGRSLVQFVSVLAKRSGQFSGSTPLELPATGRWYVRVLARNRRFVLGVHRREMKAIRYLGELEKRIGIPMTTRSWTTIQAVARTLEAWSVANGGYRCGRTTG